MRNFQHIASGIDTIPILNALACKPHLWNQETLRTAYPETPHNQVDDILLRFNDIELYKNTNDATTIMDGHESINHVGMFQLPQVRPVIFDLMRRVEGERLGRVIITRLAPGNSIAPHTDGGDHAAYYDRYHVTLKNEPGSMFHCGGEACFMAPGTVWWFDNGVEHSVVNHSNDDRITLIVDIRTLR